MSRIETLVESKASILKLSPAEADALVSVGRQLASKEGWWGADEEVTADRTVIRCQPAGTGRYQVRVSEAVGVVSVGELQLHVQPKIPVSHLLWLFARSGKLPRLSDQMASLATSADLLTLIAEWYVSATESVLRRDLIRDYSAERDFLKRKRGRIDLLPSARAFYRGRIGLYCEYDEFSTDTPLNRVLKAAARVILRRGEFRASLRKRAAAVVARMEDVGALQHTDLRAQLERRTTHYREAIALARNLLQWEGRFLEHGAAIAWTFLIRTPEMVETGLRNVISEAIGSVIEVHSRGRKLKGSKLTFNPDLVFGDAVAVGDVKYKLLGMDWNRADLYQLIAFSAHYGVPLGLLVGFARPAKPWPIDVRVADMDLRVVVWPASVDLSPAEAAAEMVDGVCKHLESYVPGLGQLDLKLTA